MTHSDDKWAPQITLRCARASDKPWDGVATGSGASDDVQQDLFGEVAV